MADHPRSRIGLGALAGALGGAAVGVADGLRAALLVGAGARIALGTAILAASVDALAGLLAGAVAEGTCRLALWGRRTRSPIWARALASLVAGAGAAAAAAVVVSTTALRRNRFLAAGLTALAGVVVALAGALLAPALARLLGLLGPKRSSPDEARPAGPPEPALLLVGPLLVALAGGVVFVALARTHAPLRGDALVERSVWAAAAAFLLPIGFAWVSAAPSAGPLARGRAPRRRGLRRVGAARARRLLGRQPPVRSLDRHPRRAGDRRGGDRGGALAAPAPPPSAGRHGGLGGRARRPGGVGAPARLGVRAGAQGRQRARRRWSVRRWRRGGRCSTSTATAMPGRSAAATATTAIRTSIRARSTCRATASTPTATARTPPTRCRRPRRWPSCRRRSRPISTCLLVTIDTLRADHLGCYGYGRPTSPAIDALAAEGALFENGWAHAPSTRYSMPAHRHRPLAVGDHLGRVDLVAAPRAQHAHHRRGAARRRLFHRRDVQLQLLRHRRPSRLRARHGSLPLRPRRAARGGQRADGVARLVVARDDRRRDRLRRRAQGPEVLPVAALLRSAPLVRAARRGPLVRIGAHGSLRRRDPLHRSARRAPARPPARGGPLGQDGHRRHRRPRRGVRRARRDRARLRPLHGADARAVHRARAGAGAAPGGGAGRPRRHRADAGEPGARPGRAELHRPFAGPRPRRAAGRRHRHARGLPGGDVGAREEARLRDRPGGTSSGTRPPATPPSATTGRAIRRRRATSGT